MIKFVGVLACLMLLSANAWGNARAQLDAFAEGLVALSGSFEQFTIDESGRVVEETAGRLYFSEPNLFRWDYADPFPQQIVADGENLWHYDESLDQVTVREQPDASESPLLVLTQPELLDRFYRLRDGDDPDVLEFLPLEEVGDFERARLHFRDGMPERLDLVDRFGQQTRVVLKDLVRNPQLEQATFQFEVPEGVDLLEGY